MASALLVSGLNLRFIYSMDKTLIHHKITFLVYLLNISASILKVSLKYQWGGN